MRVVQKEIDKERNTGKVREGERGERIRMREGERKLDEESELGERELEEKEREN